MKKVRILAVILAVLVLPFGLLFSCKKNTETDDPSDSSSWTTGHIETQEVTTQTPVDDGKKDGYLLYFSFDAAERGEFRTDLEPYKSYFTLADKEGASYLIDDKGDANGKGALLIQREGAKSDPYVEFSTLNMGTNFTAQHTVEFDVKIGEGIVGDGITFYSRKSVNNAACAQEFVAIKEDGVYDGDGTLVYEFPSFGWYHISVAVDDEARVYDVYVNGGKLSSATAYSNLSYPAFSEQRLSTYRLSVNSLTSVNTYAYIDNLSFCSGLEPSERDTSKDNIIYKESFTSVLKAFEATKDGALKAINGVSLSGSSKIASLFSLYKIKKDAVSAQTEIPLIYDYSVEMGGNYGGVFGGRLYVNKENNEQYIQFVNNVDLTVKTNIRGSLIEGVYKVYGSEEAPELNFTIKDGALERVYYGALREDVLYLYNESSLTTSAGEFVLYESEIPFNGTRFVADVENFYISVLIDDYFKKVDFIVHTADDNLELPEAAYAYADGVLTITAGGKDFVFNYADDALTFGSGDDLKKLEVYIDNSKWETAEDETLALKWQNFASGRSTVDFYADVEEGTGENWTNIRFNYYIPEGTVNYTFLLIVDTGTSAEGWSYFNKTFKQSRAGWYTFDAVITTMGVSRSPDMSRFVGKVSIASGGWSNGPAGATGKAADGYAIYIQDIELYTSQSVIVKGPEAGKEDCTHNFVASDEFVEPTCTFSGYYPLVCSECGATRVDFDRENKIVASRGHNYEGGTERRVEPTCSSNGYVYNICVDCGAEKLVKTLEPLGHDYAGRYNAETKAMVQTCKICGAVSEMVYSDRMMTAEEKIEKLGLTDSDCFAVYAGKNESYSFGSTSTSNSTDAGFLFVNAKNSVIKAVDVSATSSKMLKYQRGTIVNTDPYLDLDIDNRYTEAHVIEFTFKLGEAVDGKYPELNSNYITRPASGMWAVGIFTIDSTGLFKLSSNSNCTIQLSEDQANHFAFVFRPKSNSFDLYVDGYLRFSDITMSSDARIANFVGNDYRISFKNTSNNEAGMSFYINDMMAYEAETPLSVLGESSNEYSGDIALDGVTDGKVSVADSDKILTLPKYVLTSAYVLDFTITADALADGALLAGNKTDAYGFENVLDLVTVKNGYIYVLDRPVCKASDASDGVRITLLIDDVYGEMTVYVDGTAVAGGAVKYPDGYYGSDGAMINSIIFKSEVGAYEISALDMYTGFSVKE